MPSLHWWAMWFPWTTKKDNGPDGEAKPARKNGRRRPDVLAHYSERGPFDIIGDVHGCIDELLELLARLGYRVERRPTDFAVTPSAGRRLAFVGDLVNRGPATPDVLRLAMSMVRAGQAFCVAGNQDVKLARALTGENRKVTGGVERSLLELDCEPVRFRAEAAEFLEGLASHYVLDNGNLVIAHAGLKERLHGSNSEKAHRIAVNGQTTGKTDDYGMPVRDNWAERYRGKSLVVYGHTPVPEPLWLNNTADIDTGCVYGGYLTALRYPEREMLQVPAKVIYYPSRKRFLPNKALAASRKTMLGPI